MDLTNHLPDDARSWIPAYAERLSRLCRTLGVGQADGILRPRIPPAGADAPGRQAGRLARSSPQELRSVPALRLHRHLRTAEHECTRILLRRTGDRDNPTMMQGQTC